VTGIYRTIARPVLICLILTLPALAACRQKSPQPAAGRLRVVTTLFPLYDFVRNVGGDSVTVSLLLPPGVEAHSFEPKPEDVLTVARADLFIYTSREMEPWAEKLVSGVADSGKPVRLEAGSGAHYLEAAGGTDNDHHRHAAAHGSSRDPHIWLDIRNAKVMVDNIAAALATASPAKKELFLANAAAYKKQLAVLEARFQAGLATCKSREFVHGGHYAFAYLADRYQLNYLSAFGVSAESEPSPRKLVELVNTVRSHNLHYIFYEELLSPRIARTVADETGVQLLQLHGVHNLTRAELDGGASYLSLMEQNLANLGKGLECR
jgi:zinc transport system substrate-binding protein